MLERPLIEAAGLIRLPSQHPDDRYDYYLGAGLDTPKIRNIFIPKLRRKHELKCV